MLLHMWYNLIYSNLKILKILILLYNCNCYFRI